MTCGIARRRGCLRPALIRRHEKLLRHRLHGMGEGEIHNWQTSLRDAVTRLKAYVLEKLRQTETQEPAGVGSYGQLPNDGSRKCLISGAEGQNRTVDTSLFRAVLCQLSYLGTESFIWQRRADSSNRNRLQNQADEAGGWSVAFLDSFRLCCWRWRRHVADKPYRGGGMAERAGFEPATELLAL